MDSSILNRIEKFFSQFRAQTYKKGEILIRADDNPQGIFYLKNGYVKQYVISKKGEELVVNVFKPVAFFPMSWAINDTPNAYFFEAMTDVQVFRAPRDKVVAFIKSEPDILFNLMQRVYKGTDGILARMTYLMSGNAYSRLLTELLIYAKRFGEREGIIQINISEKELAAQSGMTRETVSREMKILKDKGIVVINKNRHIIKDLSKLEEEWLKEN